MNKLFCCKLQILVDQNQGFKAKSKKRQMEEREKARCDKNTF